MVEEVQAGFLLISRLRGDMPRGFPTLLTSRDDISSRPFSGFRLADNPVAESPSVLLFCFRSRRGREVGVALSEPMAPQTRLLSFRNRRGHAMASRALGAAAVYYPLRRRTARSTEAAWLTYLIQLVIRLMLTRFLMSILKRGLL